MIFNLVILIKNNQTNENQTTTAIRRYKYVQLLLSIVTIGHSNFMNIDAHSNYCFISISSFIEEGIIAS